MVNSDTSFMAFGRYLKSMRTQMGIPIESVADELKISTRQLSRIEAEEHEYLPDVVYVKGILRAYARYIGVDPDDIVERYLINRSAHENRLSENKFLGYGTKAFYRLCVMAAGAIILIVLSIYLVYGSFSYPKNQQVTEDTKQIEIPTPLDAEATNGTNEFIIKDKKLFLQIDALENTDLKIIIDDSDPLKYSLHPLDHMELEASSAINLLLNNPAGVKISLNGKPVPIPENSGDFVNIELP